MSTPVIWKIVLLEGESEQVEDGSHKTWSTNLRIFEPIPSIPVALQISSKDGLS